MTPRQVLRVEGAEENNLRNVDVSFPPGITAVVGVSGSGKSSLVFDTIYHEARRRFLEALALGSPALRMRPARVRGIQGLGPAVAVAQHVVNRNPNSTVATAIGIHPFLRVLYARFAERHCGQCGEIATTASLDEQLAALRGLIPAGPVEVIAPLVRRAEGTHARLLAYLAARFPPDAIDVDGRPWAGRPLDPATPHEITVLLGTAEPGADARALRQLLTSVAALGTPHIRFRRDGIARTLSRAHECPGCGARLPAARPQDFHEDLREYRLGGRTLPELLRLDVNAATVALAEATLPPRASRARQEIQSRLTALAALGLGYLPLDRPSPTLSRGEAQRVRLAVILANGVEDLLHIIDEPTIGLDPDRVKQLLRELGRLRGPVILVEHDRQAVAAADHVVELGLGAGPDGGRVVFEGPPALLWTADTPSGRWFSGRVTTAPAARRAEPQEWLTVRGARLHNLRSFDCAFPLGVLTAVTGPSGAGKTTLVRDVLVASLDAGEPRGCAEIDGPPLKAVFVDQSPIGRNPRSNPATYTGLAERIRAVFAAETSLPGSTYTFNRPEGACPECDGMGAVEVKLRYLPSEWLTCEACQGRRFGSDALEARVLLADNKRHTIAEVYESTVDEAVSLFRSDARAMRILSSLRDVGLGYLRLGQPSPTLSGGESQRVRLARQLARPAQLVVLDEPTTGLHLANLAQLLDVLRALVERGCGVLVVEHNPDVVATADWVIRLGPRGGPDGGALMHTGPPEATAMDIPRPRRAARAARRSFPDIRVRGATANNLRDVSVTIRKDAMTAVVGVSGSGKSSLVHDVLAAEATRRLLECLSMYERQSVREGPEAAADSIVGLGPTVAIGPERGNPNPRSTVGTATELSHHLGALLARAAGRHAAPTDFSPATYESACLRCHGVGTIPIPRIERLIPHPDRPICAGALYSPGFYPESYLCKPANGGYWMLQALGERYGFDPCETPWRDLSDAAKEAFLNGEEQVEMAAEARRSASRTVTWRGVLKILAGWDVGGLYTEHVTCPECDGERLRPPLLAINVAGWNRHTLHHEPVTNVLDGLSHVDGLPLTARRRLEFLVRVGLGYLHLDRLASTLSAGEAQRVKLASLLGTELTGMTVLLDEPSRGLHPREVDALSDALSDLRANGNTVVFVDHDPLLTARADHLVVLGPGAGRQGGTIVSSEPAVDIPARATGTRAEPSGLLVVRKPTENNLSGEDIAIPLGVLTGICGVSGSGKSTLAIDIVARALAPVRQTRSVARDAVDPGAHERIDGAPQRTVYADQGRAGIHSPGAFLGVLGPLRRAYAQWSDTLDPDDLVPRCDACRGRGSIREDMSFLPAVEHPCDACEATGYRAEARELVVRGLSLPALEARTLDEVHELWGDHDAVARPLRAATRLGLDYLALGQHARTLSGGERQRLKLARELAKPAPRPTLYILDEPTVGLHATDVARLVDALDGLVRQGHSVLVVDHDPTLLCCCDRLVELGPEGGPGGGRVIAAGTPEDVAAGETPTAPYLRAVLAS